MTEDSYTHSGACLMQCSINLRYYFFCLLHPPKGWIEAHPCWWAFFMVRCRMTCSNFRPMILTTNLSQRGCWRDRARPAPLLVVGFSLFTGKKNPLTGERVIHPLEGGGDKNQYTAPQHRKPTVFAHRYIWGNPCCVTANLSQTVLLGIFGMLLLHDI